MYGKGIYWEYGSSKGTINVYLRATRGLYLRNYLKFVNDFIEKYKSRIINRTRISKLLDGSFICVVYTDISIRTPGLKIDFPNKK